MYAVLGAENHLKEGQEVWKRIQAYGDMMYKKGLEKGGEDDGVTVQEWTVE